MSLKSSLIMLVVGPAMAAAQFTTFVPPQPAKKQVDSIKAAVVAEARVRTDSVSQAKITDMKTWVDSASGVAVTPAKPGVLVDAPATPKSPAPAFQDGATAPNTATNLPSLVLIGLAGLGLGAFLLRGTPSPTPARIKSRRI